MARTITRTDYYALLGLLKLAEQHNTALDNIVAAACQITGELKDDGSAERGGHTSDMLFSPDYRSLDEVLRLLDITIEDTAPTQSPEVSQ